MFRIGSLLAVVCVSVFVSCAGSQSEKQAYREGSPNVIIIFADDLGYGDLSSFGHPSIVSPNLDRMVNEGQKWTNFYSAANVCTPSRAALLTGRYPLRNGMSSDVRRVLFPNSAGGLPQTENTIARILKTKDYATAAIGKWHLGHLEEFLPTNHGFDYYYGIPYSNDMDAVNDLSRKERFWNAKSEYFNVPLMRNTEIIERPVDQTTITKRYTQEAIKFMGASRSKPFFIYLAHNMPHVPLFASEEFLGISDRGLYGDVVEEIDWSVGQILNFLESEGLSQNTLVIFTSDNGPWAAFDDHGGSSGPFFGAKGTSYEGGVREPAIFWWPGQVPPAVVTDMGSTLDLLPTIASLTGAELPTDRTYDGFDLSGTLLRGEKSPRNEMFFYHSTRLFAARKGPYKAHYYQNNPRGYPERMEVLERPKLYQVQHDPGEQYDLAAEHPEVLEEIAEMVEKHRSNLVPAPTNLESRLETP